MHYVDATEISRLYQWHPLRARIFFRLLIV